MAPPRIISGSAKGIRLKMVPGDITRPITDLVKEALFNILGEDVIDSVWLDLFGGTGSVGLEALSRGAAFCRFIDLHSAAIETIRRNLQLTKLSEKAEVHRADALALLRRQPDRRYDYIYIAPPQYKGLWSIALSEVDQHAQWLSDESWVIVQIDPQEYSALALTHLQEIQQRKYGNTLLVIYEPLEFA